MDEKRDEKVETPTDRKRRVGPFELERKLGVGGMGVVYLATYLKTGQKMAVKVLAPELSSDQPLVRRFLREIEILSRLRHDQIVRYYGKGKDKSQHFYAMEYMDGGSIEGLLKKKGRLTWEETIDYARQVALALEYSHNNGIVHRDLKPANLFLAKDGQLRLGDFGIARDTQATALTAAGRTVGTYAYMAPEQIAGKPPVSRKTDLYALGCVMFEMLTGQTPFPADTPAEMLFAHLEQDPPPVTSLALDCPVWLENLIEKLLQKDPEERFYDALAVQVALDEVRDKVTAQQSVTQQTLAGGADGATAREAAELRQTITGKKKKKKKKHVPVYERAWFLGACLILLVGLVSWGFWPVSDQTLFASAKRLMDTRDPVEWETAREKYLEPLLRRSPTSEFAPQAREYIDQIDMDLAERQSMKKNREPRSEAERLFMEAMRFQQFQDRISALQRYRSLIDLHKDRDEDRAYVNLARKKIHEIEEGGTQKGDVVSLVNENLKKADEHVTNGQAVDAHRIWNGVVTLYGNNRELERQVAYARARLNGEKTERPAFGFPVTPSKDPPPKEKP